MPLLCVQAGYHGSFIWPNSRKFPPSLLSPSTGRGSHFRRFRQYKECCWPLLLLLTQAGFKQVHPGQHAPSCNHALVEGLIHRGTLINKHNDVTMHVNMCARHPTHVTPASLLQRTAPGRGCKYYMCCTCDLQHRPAACGVQLRPACVPRERCVPCRCLPCAILISTRSCDLQS
jgi:hypothetical protein